MRLLILCAVLTLRGTPDIQIIVKDPDKKTLDLIRFFQENLPDKQIEIQSGPTDSLWQKTIKGLSGGVSNTTSGIKRSKSTIAFLFKFFIGGSTFSYLTVLYLLYRVYRIIKKINGFMSWWGGSDDEGGDVIQEIDRMFFRSRAGSKRKAYLDFQNNLKSDYQALLSYKKLDQLLRKWHIRNLFPYSKLTGDCIDLKLKELVTLQQYTKKRVRNLC